MPSLHFVAKKTPYAKRWLRLFIDRDIGTHTFEGQIAFTRKERERVKRFLTRMDSISYRCSRARRGRQLSKVCETNKSARRWLEKTGRKLFNIIKKATNAPIGNVSSLGEYGNFLTLHVDPHTRKFPWEFAFDGDEFICSRFAVGRKVINPPYEYIPQSKPLHRSALVVGLNYDWPDCKLEKLDHCVSEVRSVKTQLKKSHYRVNLLTEEKATVKEVKKHLKEGVSIFHFTGHGAYRVHSRAGERGILFLADGCLTAEDLRTCFESAGGAPYLSFLNACQTAQEIYSSGLMDAFVDLGAENVIGTFWSVFDEPSKVFARSFYKSIVDGIEIGYAVKKARDKLLYGKTDESVTWPAFVLYGDPSCTLPRAP